MKAKQELADLRKKDVKVLLSEMEKERLALAKNRIALKLGKQSKVHEQGARRTKIARMMTVLAEKVRSK